jgi:ABC-type nitrate/sulfonate/bicarbonate transport system permease component
VAIGESTIDLARARRARQAVVLPALGALGARAVRDWIPPLLIILGVIAVWQIASSTGLVKDFVLPGVVTVVGAWVTDSELIAKHAVPTVTEALLGFTIANTAAVALAVLFVHPAWPSVGCSRSPSGIAASRRSR